MMLQSQLPADKAVVLDGQQLDRETIQVQRAARGARARGAKTLLGLLLGGLIVVFGTAFWLSRTASGEAALAFFLLFAATLFGSVYFLNNWWQWRVLLFFGLVCPHCGKPLADQVHWTRRPAYSCPDCGKRALATARELGDA